MTSTPPVPVDNGWHGRQGHDAMKKRRARKREEAEARNDVHQETEAVNT